MSGYDVVVVGARCAGAALATHLARAGMSVAVVDAAPLRSNQPASTHLIQPPGMDELASLGVRDQVRALAPALHAVRMDFDGHVSDFFYEEDRPAHCLRRSVLDPLLQDAAIEAGADLHGDTRVVGLSRNDAGAIDGVEVERRGGGRDTLSAPLVVGADGRNSVVARMVGAQEYLGYDAPRGCYWAYWRRPEAWDPHVVRNCFAGFDQRVVFPTDADLILIASAPPLARAREWRADHTAAYLADVRSYAPIASVVHDADPVSEVRGVLRNRYFFREAVGPGWALAGDAGHHKDFIIGLGIADALRDARALAHAIVDGAPDAMQRYWRGRDASRIALFHWGHDLGAADQVTALERLVGDRVKTAPDVQRRLGSVIDGKIPPFRLVPPGTALRWAVGEAAHGRAGALVDVARTAVREVRASRLSRAARSRGTGRRSPSLPSSPPRSRDRVANC